MSNGDWLEFMADGDATPKFWLSDGWTERRRKAGSSAGPSARYRRRSVCDDAGGLRPVDSRDHPVRHISDHEATVLPAGPGKHLPSEVDQVAVEAARARRCLRRRSRDWGRAAPTPYPGYRAAQRRLGQTGTSSWSTRWCCAARPWRRPRATRGRLIVISLSVGAAVQRIASGRVRTLSVQMNIQTVFRAPRPI